MISNIIYYLKLFVIFLPLVVFQFLNSRSNYKKENRHKQFIMPIVSLVYFLIMSVFIKYYYIIASYYGKIFDNFLNDYEAYKYLNAIKDIFADLGGYIALVFVCIIVLSVFAFIKRIVLLFFKKDFGPDTLRGKIAGIFYEYDEIDNKWYLKESFGQARTFIKSAYYIVYILSAIVLFWSYNLYTEELLQSPFCPVLLIIVLGEISFFVDGQMKEEARQTLEVNKDNSRRIAMYALLRKPLKKIFGDKLASEGTTINVLGQSGSAAEDILESIEKEGNHIGENYAIFMRKKIDGGLVPNVDYLRSGYDLAVGKSLLFNTPFYDKLIPYAFYAINRCLLAGQKVLVVMGRHGTEEDLTQWCKKGVYSVTNVSDLYKISVLSGKVTEGEDSCDIGIISRSGVHDLDIHKANAEFLSKVGFVVIIEPSRLVTTAQIGLNLLIKCCSKDQKITFCSMDRNCDGLVDSLSHILMTDITEVSATEYPHGMSSFMCWKSDDDYLQHRLFPGVSRYLGLGTELSFVALKNQVKQAVWYGGDSFPVLDAHWISKQYYYDFLKYANLPTTQECFDQYFKTSFNMCNESVSDYSYVTVEDDRNNLFEARRNFATIAENQGFVNVISSEYMLREYMADNTEIFTADAKAIPYITADYARTKRNSVLLLCLLLCVGNVSEIELKRKLSLMGVENTNYEESLWNEICILFSNSNVGELDKEGNSIIIINDKNGAEVRFTKGETIIFKREYSIDTGKFENVYTIENKIFAGIILDDLQNAGYIAELDGKDCYIGTELKGHVYQKYLPGQFFTLNGKYYEMVSTTADNKILIRRASEHINGRVSYRQVRNYVFNNIRNSDDMGALKTVKNIDMHYLYADFEVQTSGYWKLNAYNDFENGSLVEINAVPVRKYYNKQILKLDFSKMGEMFTDSVRKTLTVLLNEVFVTLFAENQPFISAVTSGECGLPSTYSLTNSNADGTQDNAIYIIEDSQLDIGLLIAVERNIDRIMQIVSDYLIWNKEKIENVHKENQRRNYQFVKPESAEDNADVSSANTDETENNGSEKEGKAPEVVESTEPVDDSAAEDNKKEKSGKFGKWFKGMFKKSKKEKDADVAEPENDDSEQTPDVTPEQVKSSKKEEKKKKRNKKSEVVEPEVTKDSEVAKEPEGTGEPEEESEVVYSE